MLTDEKNKTPVRKRDNKGIFLRLSKYVLQQWHLFVPALLFTLLSNQLSLLGPRYSGAALDAIEAVGGVDFPAVWENVIRMIVCYALSAGLSYVLAVIMIRLSQKITYKMRKELFEKLNTLPVGYFDTHHTGDIISHLSYDIDTVNSTLSHDLVQVMTSIYTVVGSLIFMWRISKPMILIFVFTVPVSILFTRYRSKKVRPLFRKRSKKYGELNGYAEEMLSGARSIEAYGRQDVIAERFENRNEDAMNAYYDAEYSAALLFPTINLINNISIAFVAIFGGILYMYSQSGAVAVGSAFFISLGGVAQFVQYSRKFAGPINEFSNILHEFQSAFSAAERVFRVLDEPSEPADVPDARQLSHVDGNVEVDFNQFADIVDLLGGVPMELRNDEAAYINGDTQSNLSGGLQTLNGIAAHNGELECEEYTPGPLKGFAEFDRIIENCYTDPAAAQSMMPCTLEGAVVRLSDIIAYLGKDRQDAARAKMAEESMFFNEDIGSINAEIINNLVVKYL
mgnify:CR=1 FL=1